MAKVKALVVGLGSIGRKWARRLGERGHEVTALRREGGAAVPGLRQVTSWDEALAERPDVAFVCTPTHLHAEAARRLIERGVPTWIEKPLGVSLEPWPELARSAESKGVATYVAYPLRFHGAVRLMREALAGIPGPKTARVAVSSYLPSWREGRTSHQSYSARRAEGGGVVLDLSHELDLAWHLFGPWEWRGGVAGRLTDVTVDAEDWAHLLLKGAGAESVAVHLDFGSRFEERTVTVETPRETLRADLRAGTFARWGKGGPVPAASAPVAAGSYDQMYADQLEYFLAHRRDPKLENSLSEAIPVFSAILDVRRRLDFS